MESPLPYDDQDDETKFQFEQLWNSIVRILNGISSQEEIRALNKRIQREVTTRPIQARIVQGNVSILWVACLLDNKLVHPAIKFLILANPYALLWQSYVGERIINNIASHSTHCVLMPWIATNYQWVLDHEVILESPPMFDLLARYSYRDDETECTAFTIKRFFEAYPQGFMSSTVNGLLYMHIILMGTVECEPDLFKWMAEQCPSNMSKQNTSGLTPLHIACLSLTCHLGDDSSEICKYLIAKCPESVRILGVRATLPIHLLRHHCQHRTVKEVVVCLLRAYPESYNMITSLETIDDDDDDGVDSSTVAAPSSIPFIQRIKPLLDEERELKENVAYLQDVAGVFRDAVDGTQTPSSLASSTCDAFVNWATLTTIQRLEAKMEQILMQLENLEAGMELILTE